MLAVTTSGYAMLMILILISQNKKFKLVISEICTFSFLFVRYINIKFSNSRKCVHDYGTVQELYNQ